MGLHSVTGFSLHSLHVLKERNIFVMRNVETYICLQSGLVWVEQWEEERILQVKVLVISTPELGSGSWYQSSCLVLQVTSGTMN